MNVTLFNLIHNLSGHSVFFDAAGIFFAKYMMILILAVGAALLLWRAHGKDGHRAAIRLFITVLAAWLADYVIKLIVRYPRPFHVLHFTPLIPESGNSFPSGHATVAFALAFGYVLLWPHAKKRSVGDRFIVATVFAVAVLVALARVFVGVHWPLDIVGGSVLGALVAYALHSPFTLLGKEGARE